MARIKDFFKNLKQKRQERRELRQNLRRFHKRFQELEVAMDKLISDHMVVKSIEDYYTLIDNYISCRDAKEYNYCKNYINSKVRKGYLRYDDERLR